MVCLGLEPGAAGWKAQTNPLSYGGTPSFKCLKTIFKAMCNLIFKCHIMISSVVLPDNIRSRLTAEIKLGVK